MTGGRQKQETFGPQTWACNLLSPEFGGPATPGNKPHGRNESVSDKVGQSEHQSPLGDWQSPCSTSIVPQRSTA